MPAFAKDSIFFFHLYRGPLNEDVFAVPSIYTEDKILHPSIQEITEQIYRLLLQVQAGFYS